MRAKYDPYWQPPDACTAPDQCCKHNACVGACQSQHTDGVETKEEHELLKALELFDGRA